MVIWKLSPAFPVYKIGDFKNFCGPLPWYNVQSYICGPSSKAVSISMLQKGVIILGFAVGLLSKYLCSGTMSNKLFNKPGDLCRLGRFRFIYESTVSTLIT
jgi:hypothetical protein